MTPTPPSADAAPGRTRRRSRGVFRARAVVFAAMLVSGWAWPAAAETAAVVVMYHRFGDDRYPSTNTTLEQFDAHIRELQSGPYTVMGLPEIVDALRHRKPLPDRAVGISIDDAYLSVYREAWPRLRAAGFPFTLFIATDAINRNMSGFMSWDQIRELKAAGVTIGSQTETHPHMPKESAERNRAELERSNRRFEQELGSAPKLFAYPYGESSLTVQNVVADMGFVAAFGQHSGAFSDADNRFDLPRFAMNETYGDIGRFRLAVNALPLPVTDITPADPLIGANNPPAMGFTLTQPLKGLDRLACFASHAGRARVERLGEARIEVRVDAPFPQGRTRVNCTFPAHNGRWHWFGRQFYLAD